MRILGNFVSIDGNVPAETSLIHHNANPTIVGLSYDEAPYIEGPPGPVGPGAYGFGYASYQQDLASQNLVFQQNTRQRLSFSAQPTINTLKPPFDAHNFWNGASLRPRGIDDTAILRLTLSVISFVINGRLIVDLDIGGSIGILEQRPITLNMDAGAIENTSLVFVTYMRQTFLANGGAFYITPSVPIQLKGVSLLVIPIGAGTPP